MQARFLLQQTPCVTLYTLRCVPTVAIIVFERFSSKGGDANV